MRLLLILFAATASWSAAPFWVRVVDAETGRGVPLVQLSTPRDAIRFWTDSNGVAAIDDATLDGHDITFKITSHGYEFEERIFNDPAKKLRVQPGAPHAELKMRRTKYQPNSMYLR